MRKYLLIAMLLLVSLSSHAQAYWFRTTQFAQATVVNNRYYWGSWYESDMELCMDTDAGTIVVYSPVTQKYWIYASYNGGNAYADASGGTTLKFYVIDQDYDKGTVRLRIDRNGNSQVYVDFADVAWVYTVVRIR